MKKNLKKILVFGLTILMSMAMLTACGGDGNNGNSSDTPSSGQSSASPLTKDEYIQQITDISTQITEISSKYSDDMNSGDTTKTAEATRNMVAELKPLYDQLSNLSAPEEFAEQQSRITEGCEASLEALDLSLEVIDLSLSSDGSDVTDATAKMQELTDQINSLEEKANAMQTALTEIMSA